MRLAVFISLALTAPAPAQGPATAPSDYAAERGAPFGEASAHVWEVGVDAAGSDSLEKQSIAVRLGPDWASWRAGDEPARLVDLLGRRFVTIGPDRDETGPGDVVNSSLYAEARRRIDIYAGLSEGGARDQIAFGGDQTFHRIWLEAAMGVAAQAGALEIEQADERLTALHGGAVIAQAWFAPGDDSPCETDPAPGLAPMLAMLRHAAPLHPDLISAFRQLGAAPCALEFEVVSPESPQGRTERWTLRPGDDSAALFPDGASVALPRADLIGPAGRAAADAANSDAPAPEPAAFYEAVMNLRAEGDFAGAFLTTVQETHHFGPCPDQAVGSARLICAEINTLTQAGLGDADFERALEGVTAVREGDHPTAVERLSGFLSRDDFAGAAARILVANELVAWGREGLESRPDLDPAALLSEALVLDPHAPDAYWHLGRRYLEAGAPHAAWTFFDLGRRLPGRTPTPLLEQSDALEARVAALAPDLVPAPRRESSDLQGD